jgi:hypothetical protein
MTVFWMVFPYYDGWRAKMRPGARQKTSLRSVFLLMPSDPRTIAIESPPEGSAKSQNGVAPTVHSLNPSDKER